MNENVQTGAPPFNSRNMMWSLRAVSLHNQWIKMVNNGANQ